MKKSLLFIPVIPAAVALIGGVFSLLTRPSGTAAFAPIALAVQTHGELPYLITADGQLLEANTNGIWHPIGPEAKVEDVLDASTGHVWAATASGLYLQQGDTWQLVDDIPGQRLESTHGYLFVLGPDKIIRLTESKEPRLDALRRLDLPAMPAIDLVMLGSHTHVLRAGDQVFQTIDVGLSWRPLNPPEPVRNVWTGPDGNLLAATDAHVLRLVGDQWSIFLPLPEGHPVQAMRVYDGRIYVLAADMLYEQNNTGWRKISLPDSQNARFVALEFEYPDTLWLLDAAEKRLYATQDGQNWIITPLQFDT